MKVSAIYKELSRELAPIYGDQEAASITNLLLAELCGISRTKRLTQGDMTLSAHHQTSIESARDQLLQMVPVQHIIGHAYFIDRKFEVNSSVLIPRPETEELTQLIINNHRNDHVKILDIGTGTGCIAVSLALALENAKVEAWDISEDALKTAAKNAKNHNAKVIFKRIDVLTADVYSQWDVIVSNPPYIPEKDRATMHENVTKHEPGLALYVPDDDPLLFYRVIGMMAIKQLNPGGKLYLEIHEKYGDETIALLNNIGFDQAMLYEDMQNKPRMIVATKAP